MTSRRATDFDRYIGGLIRKHREAKGSSQMTLAAGIGVTYQQLQKYENGLNRITASRLYEIAKDLKVPVALFFP